MDHDQQRGHEMVQERMNAVGQVRRDHARLRQHLALVESVFHLGAPAWPILQEDCVDLAVQLDQHIAREQPVRIRYLTHGRKGTVRKGLPDHKDQARQLRAILRHLIVEKDVSPKDVDTILYAILDDLQEQMEAQEEELIPTVITNLSSRSYRPVRSRMVRCAMQEERRCVGTAST